VVRSAHHHEDEEEETMWAKIADGYLNLAHVAQVADDGEALIVTWANDELRSPLLRGEDRAAVLAALAARDEPPRWLAQALRSMDGLAQAVRQMPSTMRVRY